MKTVLFFNCVTLVLATFIVATRADERDSNPGAANDPLPSWNDTESKQAVLRFVRGVCDRDSPNFVAPEDRIATFDNDGTLWCEKPLYIHLHANLARFKEVTVHNPDLKEQQPYKAILSKDVDYFLDLLEQGKTDQIVSDVFGVPFEGMTPEEYAKWNRNWLAGWRHPKFQLGFKQLAYEPMLELIDYLKANEFDVHVFTADEGAFLKLLAAELYGVPPTNVHGSSVELEYVVDGESAKLVRTAKAKYLNNWDAKPRLIFQSIGKRPIFAAGNSNGDLHMLQYVSQQAGPAMSILVHHTDTDREFAYDKHTDKVMPMAAKLGWTIVDIKDDWKRVFSTGK